MAWSPEQKSRAKQLRRSAKSRDLTPDELAELDELNSLKGSPGRPRKDASQSESDSPSIEVKTESAPEGAKNEEKAPPSLGAEIKPPKPPKPPKISMPKGGKDWRDKYQQKQGREAACVEIASVWTMLLLKCNEYTISNGAAPVITEEMINETLAPACVLTVDKLLPQQFEASPETTIAIGSTIVMGQAAYVAAKKKKQKAEEAKAQEPEPEVVFDSEKNGHVERDVPVNDLASEDVVLC